MSNVNFSVGNALMKTMIDMSDGTYAERVATVAVAADGTPIDAADPVPVAGDFEITVRTVALSGFSNPKYAAGDNADSTGFLITPGGHFTVIYEGAFTATVDVEQTADETGATGWVDVRGGIATPGAGTQLENNQGATGQAYTYQARGRRARVKVTALSGADMVARIITSTMAFAHWMQTSNVQGITAHDAAISGPPVRIGARALTANYAAVSTGDNADLVATLVGALVVRPHAIPEQCWSYAAAASGILNTTTAVTIKAAAGASVRNYLTGLDIMAEALGTATELAVRDGAGGTVLWRTKIATAGLLEGRNIRFDPPLQSTANTLLEVVTLTASGTGAVYVNAHGYSAP